MGDLGDLEGDLNGAPPANTDRCDTGGLSAFLTVSVRVVCAVRVDRVVRTDKVLLLPVSGLGGGANRAGAGTGTGTGGTVRFICCSSSSPAESQAVHRDDLVVRLLLGSIISSPSGRLSSRHARMLNMRDTQLQRCSASDSYLLPYSPSSAGFDSVPSGCDPRGPPGAPLAVPQVAFSLDAIPSLPSLLPPRPAESQRLRRHPAPRPTQTPRPTGSSGPEPPRRRSLRLLKMKNAISSSTSTDNTHASIMGPTGRPEDGPGIIAESPVFGPDICGCGEEEG